MFLFVSLVFVADKYSYINLNETIAERINFSFYSRYISSGIHVRLIYEGITTAFANFKYLILGSGYGTSFLLIYGYYFSGIKYANYHSMYITSLVECGLLNCLSLLLYTFIIPLLNKKRNVIYPFIFALFFYNIFYQLIHEPLFWFIILFYYQNNINIIKNEN